MQHQVLSVTNNFYSFGNTNRSIVESILPRGGHLLYFCHIARECIYGAVACKKHCAIWYPITPNPLLTSTVASVAILMELSSPNYLGTHQVVLPFRRNFPHPRFLFPSLAATLAYFYHFSCSSIFSCSSNFEEWQMTAYASIALAWKIFDFEQGQWSSCPQNWYKILKPAL